MFHLTPLLTWKVYLSPSALTVGIPVAASGTIDSAVTRFVDAGYETSWRVEARSTMMLPPTCASNTPAPCPPSIFSVPP